MKTLRPAEEPSYLPLPLLGQQVCCGGFSSVADDFVEKTLDLNELCIDHPAATYFVKASGDSMTPYIFSGDILIVDRSLRPRSRDVIICLLEGEFAARRFVCDTQGTWLHADSQTFKPRKVTADTEFEVWGVVSGIVRLTRPHG